MHRQVSSRYAEFLNCTHSLGISPVLPQLDLLLRSKRAVQNKRVRHGKWANKCAEAIEHRPIYLGLQRRPVLPGFISFVRGRASPRGSSGLLCWAGNRCIYDRWCIYEERSDGARSDHSWRTVLFYRKSFEMAST